MNKGKETIEKDGQIYAIIIRKNHRPTGVNFMTSDDYTLQLGLIGHQPGHHIREHIHNPSIHYKVDTTQEFLYVESGKINVTVYDFGWNIVGKTELSAGDIILQISGGHGFDIVETCYLIEVKQGPFPGDKLMKFYREDPPTKV